jgi:hypothetical protein
VARVSRTRLAAALVVGGLAFAVVAFATEAPGPGLDPDAMSYLGAAESLARAGAYRIPSSSWSSPDSTEPLGHFPPGFSTVIAGPVSLGASPLQAARWIDAVAAACTWAGLVLLVADVAGTLVGVLAAIAALATPALLNVHLSVLSEPLFLTALVGTVAGTVQLTRPRQASSPVAGQPPDAASAPMADERRRWIGAWLAGCAAAAAVTLRYAGLAVLAAAALMALLSPADGAHRWRTRVLRSLVVVLPAACTLGPWLVRTIRLAGPRSVRELGRYGDFGATLREGLATLTDWLVPLGTGPWRYPVAVALLLAGSGLAVSVRRRERPGDEPASGSRVSDAAADQPLRAFLRVLAVIGGFYLAVLVVSRLFADPNIPFDERILAPLILLTEVGAAVVIGAWWRSAGRGARVVAAVALAAWLAASAVSSWTRVNYARDEGNDFAGAEWRTSPTIAWVRAPAGGLHRVLYSNWPAALYFHAQRAAHDVPAVADGLTLHRFRDRLARSHGVVVGFTTPSPDVADPDTVARALGLRAIARFDDGTIWEAPTGPDSVPK